jgi:GNAT superfamily N-acetyltransferase
MKLTWSVRVFREGDEEGIYKLHQAVYPSEIHDRESWMRWWRWMYMDGPKGAGQIWVAYDDEEIVGQYPIVFMPMKVGSEILMASQNVDLMTHPAYRHQGMFATLERKALDELCKQGISITIGFPNEEAYLGHKKSGWFNISTMKTVFKPINWEKTINVKMKIKNRLLTKLLVFGGTIVFDRIFFRTYKVPDIEGITITQVTSFDEGFDRLWDRVSKQYPIIVVRNKNYLNWRFSGPDRNYLIFAAKRADEVQGYLVLSDRLANNLKTSVIVDMVAESEEVMQCLVSEVIKICQRLGVDLISYSMIANSAYHHALRRSGFITLPFFKGDRFCAYSSSKQFSKTFLQNPKNWLVQIGDSDEL